MNECHLCQKPIDEKKKLKIFKGKWFHLKCLRKLRSIAKRRFYGNLDMAFKSIKERGQNVH